MYGVGEITELDTCDKMEYAMTVRTPQHHHVSRTDSRDQILALPHTIDQEGTIEFLQMGFACQAGQWSPDDMDGALFVNHMFVSLRLRT